MPSPILLTEQSRVLGFRGDITSGLPVGPPTPIGRPGGLLITSDNTLVVVDSALGRLAMLDLLGGGWTTLLSPGSGPGQLQRPTALAEDAQGRLLVVDRGNHRIVRCFPDGSDWAEIGTAGGGPGQFVDPMSVTVDGRSRIVVADPGAGRVVRFDDVDGSGWSEATVPTGPGLPLLPVGVAAVGADWWAVAESGDRTVHLLDLDDVPVAQLDPASLLLLPTYLAGDADGLIVGDPVANEVRRFHPDGGILVEDRRLRGSDPSLPAPAFEQLGGVAAGRR